MDSGGSGDMTLAFELEALKELANPEAVFTDARQWTEYIGIVSDEPTYVVTNFTRKNRIRQDFFSGPQGKAESLRNVRNQFDSDRHVFISVSDADRTLAEEEGWEYLPLEEAADAAGWELLTDDGAEGDVFEEDQREDWP